MTALDLPGGPISHRPLRFYWMLDVSGSMLGEKIGALNFAVREALPHMVIRQTITRTRLSRSAR